MAVNDTLKERGKRYGEFISHASISQEMQETMQNTEGWYERPGWVRESLTMIVHKIGRVLNGDHNYKDNWHDIQGYAKLAEDLCKEDKE